MTETSPLAHRIARLIGTGDLPPGARLTERALAERFRVSRSPVRAALRELADQGVLAGAGRGFAVADAGRAGELAAAGGAGDPGEETYLAIARDRLAGHIPDRISENDLMRRYGLPRARLQALLRRISEEGWIERLPGHGWQFLPALTSTEAYRQSYRFRQAIEPAALLEPGFRADVPLLERHLARQHDLVAGQIHRLSPVQLFEVNSALHEDIAGMSGNAFFIESLRRVDRLRRLLEYRLAIDREQARLRCVEHIRILDLILAGDNAAAAETMRRHLTMLGPVKARHAEEDGR